MWRDDHPQLPGQRKAQSAAHYASNRERYLDRHYRRSYGMSLSQVEELLASQNGACALCLRDLPSLRAFGRQASVDHCHATGRVRGVLCRGCNLGLGNFREDPEALLRAIEYLRRT